MSILDDIDKKVSDKLAVLLPDLSFEQHVEVCEAVMEVLENYSISEVSET